MKEKIKNIFKNPISWVVSGLGTFMIVLKTMSGAAIVKFLFILGGGVAGFGLSIGVTMLPGIGFIVGLLVGMSFNDSQKESVNKAFENSWLKKTADNLYKAIEKSWSKFIDSLKETIKDLNKKEKQIKKASDDIEKEIKKDEKDTNK